MNHTKIKQTVTIQKEFEDKYNADRNYCKVRDHCHFTGKCRGAAHNICNLECLKKFLYFFLMDWTTIIIFFIKELGKEFEGEFN